MVNPQSSNCTLELQGTPNTVYTCGDTVAATVHLFPNGKESLSVSNVHVSFRCEVRTVITTGGGNNRQIHRATAYLFSFSTPILDSRRITVNGRHTWDVQFAFPATVQAHPTQAFFAPHALFPHAPGAPLPPSWARMCMGHNQSVHYYLEAAMTRHGRLLDHHDRTVATLLFLPPLDAPDPLPSPARGVALQLVRASRRLDPARAAEPAGLRDWSRRILSAGGGGGGGDDPTARFSIAATAPTVRCVGDLLSVPLSLHYYAEASTAPEQPPLLLKSLHVRVNDFVRYRVPTRSLFGSVELLRESGFKRDLLRHACAPPCPVADGFDLGDVRPLLVGPALFPSFATVSINHTYMLKISAVFECAGKDFDLTLVRHPLTVLPPRDMYQLIGPDQPAPSSMVPEVRSRADHDEALPLYEPPAAGAAGSSTVPPAYEKSGGDQDQP